MNYIYCLIGPSGSGKSTLAKQLVKYIDSVIIGRTQLIKHFFGYTEETIHEYYLREDVGRLDRIITKHHDKLVASVLEDGLDVILDDNHLKVSDIQHIKKFCHPIKFTLVGKSFEDLIERDEMEVHPRGEDILRQQWEQLEHLKKTIDLSKDWYPSDDQTGIL